LRRGRLAHRGGGLAVAATAALTRRGSIGMVPVAVSVDDPVVANLLVHVLRYLPRPWNRVVDGGVVPEVHGVSAIVHACMTLSAGVWNVVGRLND
jgi:hypothetical protein